jgi:YD repeat-containing protein
MSLSGKNILLLISLSLFTLNLYGQSNFEKFSKELIRQNKIKSITEWSHPYQGEKPAAKGTKNSIARFDKNGNLTEEITYNARGEETRKVSYRYDSKGNRSEYSVFEAKFNKITYSQFASYDNSGNKLSEWGFDGLGSYRNNYILNNDGSISEIHFTSQNRLTEKRIFKNAELETEISILNLGTFPSGKILLKYDQNKNLTEEIETDASGILIRKVSYTYNPAGQLIQETRFRGSNLSYINNHQYNSKGQLTVIEKEETSSSPTITHKFNYDSSGRLTEEQWYSENARDYSSRKLQYDNKNNIFSMDCFFISYKFRVMYKFSFEYH